MNRIQLYLDNALTTLLSDYAKENHCSLSRAANTIIAAYLSENTPIATLQNENKRYFLRLINVLNQILSCVYDADKVTVPSQSAQECLNRIKQSIQENFPTN